MEAVSRDGIEQLLDSVVGDNEPGPSARDDRKAEEEQE